MNPRPIRPAPVDVIAASVCWLARFQGSRAVGGVAAQATYWHPTSCRFCRLAPEELLKLRLEDCDPEALRSFKALPPAVRQARVKEAQEVAWWDQLPAANAS